jgi:hypothetical protein
MTGTNCDLFTHNQSRSYLNHLVHIYVYIYIYIYTHTHTVHSSTPSFFKKEKEAIEVSSRQRSILKSVIQLLFAGLYIHYNFYKEFGGLNFLGGAVEHSFTKRVMYVTQLL